MKKKYYKLYVYLNDSKSVTYILSGEKNECKEKLKDFYYKTNKNIYKFKIVAREVFYYDGDYHFIDET